MPAVLLGVFALVFGLVALRGKELGRWELRGTPRSGFAGEMPWPATAKSVHVWYDAVWVGSKSLPEGNLELQLLREGKTIETARCSTSEGAGVGVCGRSGGGRELGSKRQDCERRVACEFRASSGGAPATLRARLTFSEPERFRELARFQIVLRE